MIRALPARSEEPAEWAGSRCSTWPVQREGTAPRGLPGAFPRAVVSLQVGLLTRFMLGLEAERQAGGQSSARPCLLAQRTPASPTPPPPSSPRTGPAATSML